MGAEEDLITILGQASAVPFGAFFKKTFLPFNEWVIYILCLRVLRVTDGLLRSSRTFSGPDRTKFYWKRIESGLHVEVSHIHAKIFFFL